MQCLVSFNIFYLFSGQEELVAVGPGWVRPKQRWPTGAEGIRAPGRRLWILDSPLPAG